MQHNGHHITLINGSDLKIHEIHSFISEKKSKIRIADSAFHAVRQSKQFLDEELSQKIIYGVNTGFGPMASHIVGHRHLQKLQENLVRSHSVGMGDPIKSEYVLSSMIVRLNTLVKGFSGVSVELVRHLQQFINHRIIPIVPEHGAVGTSGDLVQLAHIALALIGEGEVMYQGEHLPTRKLLAKLNIRPYQLKPKEGLALINGTSVMSGIAALLCVEAQRLLDTSIYTGVLSLELVRGLDDSLSAALHRLRPHDGQVEIAKMMRKLLESSHTMQKRRALQKRVHTNHIDDVREVKEDIQQVYSFRCIPQILGPVLDTLRQTGKVVETEINSVTDNPIVDWKNKFFLHGGNFHGDYIAAAVDYLKIALVKLTMLSERRVNYFLHHKINGQFPPFLNLEKPGLSLALQGLQFVATSSTAQSQTLAYPHHIHSIPTNGDNQDVVSMGTDAALFAAKIIENAYIVLAIELIVLAQAVNCRNNVQELSEGSRALFKKIRMVSSKIRGDRVLDKELSQIVHIVKKDLVLPLGI